MYTKFKYNVWAANIAQMGSFSFRNRGFKYLLIAMETFTKQAWLNPRKKDKKVKTFLHGFIEIVNKSKLNPSKLCVDQEI